MFPPKNSPNEAQSQFDILVALAFGTSLEAAKRKSTTHSFVHVYNPLSTIAFKTSIFL